MSAKYFAAKIDRPVTTPGAPGENANASVATKSGVVSGLAMKTGFLPDNPSSSGALPLFKAPTRTTSTSGLAIIS